MELVKPTSLPDPLGSFSHAVIAGGLVFVSGTVGLNNDFQLPGDGGAAAQTTQTIENIRLILESVDLTLDSVVSATVYLQDMADYGAFAEAWGQAFGDHRPARATVRADLVDPSLKVEIQLVAELGEGAENGS